MDIFTLLHELDKHRDQYLVLDCGGVPVFTHGCYVREDNNAVVVGYDTRFPCILVQTVISEAIRIAANLHDTANSGELWVQMGDSQIAKITHVVQHGNLVILETVKIFHKGSPHLGEYVSGGYNFMRKLGLQRAEG